jgi:hypothetical protein
MLGSGKCDFVRQTVLGMLDLVDAVGRHNLTYPENRSIQR